MMAIAPLLAYSEVALAAYHSQLNQALEVHESTMADIGPKMQIQFAINGIQPLHFAALTKERVSDSADWVLYWQVTHALEEQFKQSEVITRGALAATSAQKRYSEEYKKFHPSMAANTSEKVRTEKTAWVDRQKPKVLNAERPKKNRTAICGHTLCQLRTQTWQPPYHPRL